MEYKDELEIQDSHSYRERIASVHTQYQYALLDSKEGAMCFVEDITPEFRKEHKFYCLSCGEEMVANLKDDHHRRHFKHKHNTGCSNETYLHNLAKRMLAEHFLKSEHLYVSYSINEYCQKYAQCKYLSKSCTDKTHDKRVDLKQYYQHCEIEKYVTGKDGNRYKADICLISNNPKVPPMLIEIFVSHACTEEKKNSGLWIMEISVNSEEDIRNLCNTNCYKENDITGIELFNIEKKKYVELINNQVLRFFHIPQIGSGIRRISCKEADVSLIKEADVEVNVLNPVDGLSSYDDNEIIAAIDFNIHIKSFKKNVISDCEECIHYNPFIGPSGVDNHKCDIDFFRRRPEGICKDFRKRRERFDILNQIELEFIKGSRPQKYNLFVVGPPNFYITQLIEKICNKRIAELSNKNLVLYSQKITNQCYFTASVLKLAEDNYIPFKYVTADWHTHGKSAGYKSNIEIINIADEIIVFNDPNDKLTHDLIQKAKNKNIPITLFDFSNVTRNNDICPKCGGKLVRRQGKYGQFWGCINYPDCNFIG